MFDRVIVIAVMFSVYFFSIFGLAGIGFHWKKSKVKGYFLGILVCGFFLFTLSLLFAYYIFFNGSWIDLSGKVGYILASPFRIIFENWGKAQSIILPIIGFYLLSVIIGFACFYKQDGFKNILIGLFGGQVIFSIVYTIWFTFGLIF